MDKSNNPIIVLILIVVLLLFGIIFLRSDSIHWQDDLTLESDQPYGLNLMKDLLSSSNELQDVVIKNQLIQLDSNARNENYVFIGDYFQVEGSNVETLKNFVANGNTAFIASSSSSDSLIESIGVFDKLTWTGQYADLLDVKIKESKNVYNFKHRTSDSTHNNHYWRTMDWESYYAQDQVEVLAVKNSYFDYINGNTICLKVSYGEGYFIIHCNPNLFSNYFMIKRNGFNHASEIFSHLNNGKITWDEYNYIHYNKTESDNDFRYNSKRKNPFHVLFRNKGFQWTWYILIALILVYLAFSSKRRQKAIPMMESTKNSSIDFAKAIALIYYKSDNLAHIGREIHSQLKFYIQRKYNVTLMKEMDPKELKKLSRKSGFSIPSLEKIFSELYRLENTVDMSHKDLVKVFELVNEFYKKSK